MAVKRANTLSDKQFSDLLERIDSVSKSPDKDRLVFLFSFTAGLRSQEIAGLEWDKHLLGPTGDFRFDSYNVRGANGRIKEEKFPVLFISSDIGKYGQERSIRIHPKLFEALKEALNNRSGSKFVIDSRKSGADQDVKARAHALVMYIKRFYEKIGYQNCSSHSGRRTFITNAARKASIVGCSLADVQQMAGHSSLKTTQGYIDTSPNSADLVALLYK